MAYVLSDNMFTRTRRAVLDVEGQVKRVPRPIDDPPSGWNPMLATHNSASETMPPYGVGRITGGNWLSDNRTQTISIDKPSDTFGRDYAVNGPEPIEAGKWAQCFTHGTCLVLYDGDKPEVGDELGPVPDAWSVKAGYPSICSVLGVVDDEHKIALVRLGGDLDNIVRFRLKADLYACESAAAEIIVPDDSSSGSSSSNDAMNCTCGKFTTSGDITITDRLSIVGASLLAMMGTDGQVYIPANTTGYAKLFDDAGTYEPLVFGEQTCTDASASDSASDSTSASASSACVSVLSAQLASVPVVSGKPKYLLGQDENGCLGWYATDECDDSSSSSSG